MRALEPDAAAGPSRHPTWSPVPDEATFKDHAARRTGSGAAQSRGEELGLTIHEPAFYDALEASDDTAIKVFCRETLWTIARELVDTVRQNVTSDWAVEESVSAKPRFIVKRI